LAEVHPDLLIVLSGLLESPLGVLGEIAIARLEWEERRQTLVADDSPETLRHRGYRQLDIVNSTIRSLIERELELMRRLTSLAEQLGIARVAIAPAEERVSIRGDGLDDLLAPLRMKQFQKFLDVWNGVSSDLRLRWEQSDGD
jgi:hypothetical protein